MKKNPLINKREITIIEKGEKKEFEFNSHFRKSDWQKQTGRRVAFNRFIKSKINFRSFGKN